MDLDLFFNNLKENDFIKNFTKELSNFLENKNLENEEKLYQVVEIVKDGVYLQDTSNDKIFKENISKELLNEVGNDTVLRFKDGKYIIDEELTQKFLDSLIDLKEYEDIKKQFAKDMNIEPNTIFELKEKNDKYSILKCEEKMIKAPTSLIPFWARVGEKLNYIDGEFSRDGEKK